MEQNNVLKMIQKEELDKLIRLSDEIHELLTHIQDKPGELIGYEELRQTYGLTPYVIRRMTREGKFPEPLPGFSNQYKKWNRGKVRDALFGKRGD